MRMNFCRIAYLFEQLVVLLDHCLGGLVEIDDFVGLFAIVRDQFVAALVKLRVDFPHADGFIAAGPRLLSGDFRFGPHVILVPLRDCVNCAWSCLFRVVGSRPPRRAPCRPRP